jgi:lipopolysaccharide/colanic/teichoic acid biosynthesis glycosyltransferase
MSAQPSVTPAILDRPDSTVFRHAARIANFSKSIPEAIRLPTEGQAYEAAKRLFDFGLAMLLFPIAGIIIASISLAIWLTSDGPIFFCHERIGRNGRPFTIWKFRTMHQDADHILQEHLKHDAEAREEWHQQLKLRDDPRITSLGKWLRETSLDEVPQIFNILRGEMSFVGPRPIVAKEMPRYGKRLRFYLAATPGVTGLWQISGRCNVSYESRVILDETYVRHWTMGGDLWILLHTPKAVFRKDGAC